LKIFEDKVIHGCARAHAVFKNFPSFVKLNNKFINTLYLFIVNLKYLIKKIL